jgi:hypothetical protein
VRRFWPELGCRAKINQYIHTIFFLIFDEHHFKVHNKVSIMCCLFLVAFYLKTAIVFQVIKAIIES